MIQFTVCIPIFNEEESVERIVRNLATDSFFLGASQKQVLIGLNGCTDRSEEISQALAREFSWLKVIRLAQKGKNRSWRSLVQHVTLPGPIFFFDADITIPQNTMLELFNKLTQSPSLVIVGAFPMPLAQSQHSRSLHQQLFVKWFYHFSNIHRRPYYGLCGRGYIIDQDHARKVIFPQDERIADDQFLELTFKGQFEILVDSPVFYEPPNLKDTARQNARVLLSH